jgi:two-component system sensor histidine kinase MprB
VFVALAIASLVIYVEVRSKLHDHVDVSLIQSAEAVAAKWDAVSAAPRGALAKKARLVPAESQAALEKKAHLLSGTDSDGLFEIVPRVGNAAIGTSGELSGFPPLGVRDLAVASGAAAPYFQDFRFGSVATRLYTMRLPSRSGLVRTSRPLTEANSTLAGVRRLLLGLTVGGAVVAALLGWLAANAVLRPVRALADTVREVSATRDLKRRIPVSGRDEVASLASDFNGMLQALDESQQAQQQLIADASHELRTPLTAHRANIELLARPDLPVERRQSVLGAAVRSIEELSTLVGDLIQAARNGRSLDAREPLSLDELVSREVARAQHRAPELRFESRIEPCTIIGARTRLERAVDNVLDNAIKWSPAGGAVDVRLVDGTLSVRDHGPGIPEADLPHVFDRFYRADAARALPGSGLGLAIVKQTVDDHGGSVTVANADDGGVVVSVSFDSASKEALSNLSA